MHVCRNISLPGSILIPEHAQLIVDCRGGAIALLAAPSLAFGSLLGFSQCVFTSFQPGQSHTAKPSTPQYILNWDAGNAMLLLEDSFMEQPCSVRAPFLPFPFFAGLSCCG